MAGGCASPPHRRRVLQVPGHSPPCMDSTPFSTVPSPPICFCSHSLSFSIFEKPLIFFFLDYLAAMGLFVWIGHQLAKAMLALQKRSAQQ